jgi:hypothetical protein
MEKLLPCPACGSEAEHSIIMEYANCSNKRCRLIGPDPDPDGSRWNALPRNPAAKAPEPAPVKLEPKPYEPPTTWEYVYPETGQLYRITFTRKDQYTVAAFEKDGFMICAAPAVRHPSDAQDAKIGDRVAVKRLLFRTCIKPEIARPMYDAFRKWQHDQRFDKMPASVRWALNHHRMVAVMSGSK